MARIRDETIEMVVIARHGAIQYGRAEAIDVLFCLVMLIDSAFTGNWELGHFSCTVLPAKAAALSRAARGH